MGAWGVAPFENDAALDWVGDLQSQGSAAIDRALAGARETDHLDADEASAAVAAAATFAAARGRYALALPEEVTSWLVVHIHEVPLDRIDQARDALDAVMTSELQDLWAESGELDAWAQSIDEIRTSLVAM